MRVVPIPAENPEEGAHWELLSARHRRELNIGSTQSQTTALSILVSFYLQSAVAATAEEAEIFLSPVASRSRIRDVIHGLSTTRQLASFSLAGDEQFYVEGSLPEIAEEEEPVVLAAGAIAGEDAGLEQNEPDLTEAAAANPAAISQQRPTAPRRSPRPAFGERARGSFAARDRRRRQGLTEIAHRAAKAASAVPKRQRFSERGSFRRSEGSPEGAEGAGRSAAAKLRASRAPPPERFAGIGAHSAETRPARPGSSDRPNRFARAPIVPRTWRRAQRQLRQRPTATSRRQQLPAQKAVSGQALWRPPTPLRRRARIARASARQLAQGHRNPDAPRFGKDRPGRPPRDGERPQRSFGGGEGRPFRKPLATGRLRGDEGRPDRPFRKPPQGDASDRRLQPLRSVVRWLSQRPPSSRW